MNDALRELATLLEAKQSAAIISCEVVRDELIVRVSSKELINFVQFLKQDSACQFTTLIDITCIDYPDRDPRFDVVYMFLSMVQNLRIRLKVDVADGGQIQSITSLHPSASWPEREVFDMFGVVFANHPDLRRLLSDYGFRGHPLRKDFPTTGYTEVRYDEVEKRVVYEPVKLTQEYRQFDFMSPWEGAEYILPDDENKEV